MNRVAYAVAASAALCVYGAASPARAASPRAEVQGELPEDLRETVVRAIGEADRPIENRFEARRRARAAAEDAIAVLRSEGYYAYVVEPDVGEGDAPQAVVRVELGPRFVIAAPRIAWVGPTPDAASVTAAEGALDFHPAQPGRAADVLAAEGRAVAAIQKRGYADVRAEPREVIVDHADKTLRPTFRINAGDIVRLDGVKLVAQGRTNPDWVTSLAPWTSGDAYDPEDVAELERRLLDAGIYESVTVALAPRAMTDEQGRRPVVVSLAERKPRTLELGGSYASDEGLGAEVRWTRYNVLGRADTLGFLLLASSMDSRLAATLSLPHWRHPQQTLTTGAAAYRVRTDAYDETGVGVRADVTRRYGRTSFLTQGSYVTFGASLDLSRTDEINPEELTPLGRDLLTAALLADFALDRANDVLDPRRGWRLNARAEPTFITGEDSIAYLRVSAQTTRYVPLDKDLRTVLAGRIRIGTMLNGQMPEVPASRRFYAGGGGSVRGFGYQAVGPRLSDNTPQGGLSLLETSLEARYRLRGPWEVAAFVDAGTVGSDPTPDFNDLAVGVGIGVRYHLGFGPIRVDVAVPVTDRRGDSPFQIYVSLGQSF